MKCPILYMVIPCYNEQDVLPKTAPLFLNKLKQLVQDDKISNDSRILFVNDGSKDRTWDIISNLASLDPHYQGISQSRNRGHQNAVLAGMMEAKDQCDIKKARQSFEMQMNILASIHDVKETVEDNHRRIAS